MRSIWSNVLDHLKRLGTFGGRESRGDFWPYAGGVIGLSFIGMWAAMIRPMAETMRRMQEFAAAHPDKARVVSGPGHYEISVEGHHPELFAGFGEMMIGMVIVVAVAVVLLAAAVARRLHDRGRSGFWGLMPLPFFAFGSVMMPRVMMGPAPDMGLFFLMFFNNMIYVGSLVLLVVMLAGAGSPAPNKFGSPPV